MNNNNPYTGIIPYMSSVAGSCLSLANLEEAGINTVAYHLTDLLVKPGYAVLKNLRALQDYCSWQGQVVLNCLLPKPNKEGIYTIRSPYDGSLIRLNPEMILTLACQLQVDKIILPLGTGLYFNDFWKHLPAKTMVYFHLDEKNDPRDKVGTYLLLESQTSFSQLLTELHNSEKSLYLCGNFDLQDLVQLQQDKKYLIETDKPAQDGMQGIIYHQKSVLNILATEMENDHHIIEEACVCPTCRQKLTRSYLHHLLQHTPLLAQRYLIQHNYYYCQYRLC